MKTFRVAALAAALLVGVGATAQAQTTSPAPQPGAGARGAGAKGGEHAGPDGRRGGWGRGARGQGGPALFRGIELSEAQRTQIRTIHQKYAEQRRALWSPERGTEGRRQRPDSATRVQIRSLRERQTAELRGVLTPAQQATFDQNLARARQRAEARMGERQGRRGPGAR